MERTRTRTGKVTIRDVAADAGVSTAAVSKVMRNAYGVSDELRKKVEVSIEKLGYRPSTAARGMRGRTFSIGMLLVEMKNPFLATVVEGAKESLRAAGYQTLIGVGEAEASIEIPLIESMLDLQMDGLLLVAPRVSGRLLARYAAQKPLAVIGHHEPEATTFDTINSDDRTGARLAVDGMLARGCKDIRMVSLPRPERALEVFEQRERGYLDAMSAAGLANQAQILRIRERPGGPGVALDSLFQDAPLPDGLFCWSDIHAIEILNEAHLRGIDVPGQLSVVGYDNTAAAAMPLIGLSSIEQHGATLGRLAAETLLARLAGRSDARHELVAPKLVTRRSLRGPGA